MTKNDKLAAFIFNSDDREDLINAAEGDGYKMDIETIDAIIDRDSDDGRAVMAILTDND
jgi:hypothetical protein